MRGAVVNARYRKAMQLRSRRHRKGPPVRPHRPMPPIQWGACAWGPEPCHTAGTHNAAIRQIIHAAPTPQMWDLAGQLTGHEQAHITDVPISSQEYL